MTSLAKRTRTGTLVVALTVYLFENRSVNCVLALLLPLVLRPNFAGKEKARMYATDRASLPKSLGVLGRTAPGFDTAYAERVLTFGQYAKPALSGWILLQHHLQADGARFLARKHLVYFLHLRANAAGLVPAVLIVVTQGKAKLVAQVALQEGRHVCIRSVEGARNTQIQSFYQQQSARGHCSSILTAIYFVSSYNV